MLIIQATTHTHNTKPYPIKSNLHSKVENCNFTFGMWSKEKKTCLDRGALHRAVTKETTFSNYHGFVLLTRGGMRGEKWSSNDRRYES